MQYLIDFLWFLQITQNVIQIYVKPVFCNNITRNIWRILRNIKIYSLITKSFPYFITTNFKSSLKKIHSVNLIQYPSLYIWNETLFKNLSLKFKKWWISVGVYSIVLARWFKFPFVDDVCKWLIYYVAIYWKAIEN